MTLSNSFPLEINIRKDSSLLAESIVDSLEESLKERLYLKSPKPIGLATGRTMEPLYNSLVSRLKSWPIGQFKKLLDGWISFNLDEYIGLSIDDKRSYKAYMRHYLIDPLGMKIDKVRIPSSQPFDPHVEANSYAKDLEKEGGIGIQILGLGSNGHVGFNEPPCSHDCSCRVENLTLETRKQNAFAFDNRLSSVPRQAITLGLKEILASQEIHLIVTGLKKAKVLRQLINSSCSIDLPASWLRNHSHVIIWADEPAMSKIKK